MKFQPASQTTKKSVASLYTAAIQVFAEEGITIQTKDKDAGLVIGEWMAGGVGGGAYRWKVIITEGTFVVDYDCRSKDAQVFGPDKVIKCPHPKGDNFGGIARAKAIAKAIESRAK